MIELQKISFFEKYCHCTSLKYMRSPVGSTFPKLLIRYAQTSLPHLLKATHTSVARVATKQQKRKFIHFKHIRNTNVVNIWHITQGQDYNFELEQTQKQHGSDKNEQKTGDMNGTSAPLSSPAGVAVTARHAPNNMPWATQFPSSN